MEPENREKIEETVVEILKNADMETVTEFMVRKMASEKLGIDLSETEHKRFVRGVIESFLEKTNEPEPEDPLRSAKAEVEEGEEEEEEEKENLSKQVGGVKEYDDDGDLIICRVSFNSYSVELDAYFITVIWLWFWFQGRFVFGGLNENMNPNLSD